VSKDFKYQPEQPEGNHDINDRIMDNQPKHIVAIFGGAVAGSEAAYQLAERGIHSVVFEMGLLPYGKIELGLPKWHARQQDQEERLIDGKLNRPEVTFVPGVRLGRDLALEEVVGWGFSAVLLAVGAWRDRPLQVPGIERFEGRGFYYQNPFVSWFNQYHSPDYAGPELEIADNAIVIGGGLASLDVVKILMIETVQRALRERGIQADPFTLEKKGIPKTLENLGVRWEDLGLKGCTLFYRRRDIDMPLVPMADQPTERQLEQARIVRKKLLANARAKYLFRFEPCRLPVGIISEGDRLTGLIFRKTVVENGRVRVLEDTEIRVETPLVVSSIGSLPEPIPGIPLEREFFPVESEDTGKIAGFENVFALGNAVTGKGNIRASRLHAKRACDRIAGEFLNWEEENSRRLQTALDSGNREEIRRLVREKNLVPAEKIELIRRQIRELQKKTGYDGNYEEWVSRHRPVRMERIHD